MRISKIRENIAFTGIVTFGVTLLSAMPATAAAAKKAAEHAGEHEGASFAPLNTATYAGQLFWLAITFGLLLFLLSKVLLPRLGGILEDRSNRIADDLDSAARMQRDAESAQKAFEQSLSDARAKAHNVSETTRANVTAELEAEMQEAETETATQLEQAEAKIQKTRASALANVDDIAIDTAKTISEHLLGKTVGITAIRKAVTKLG